MAEQKQGDLSCTDIILFGAFILGAILMFSKTSDLMTNFAPSSFMGYEGNSAIYGMGVALMVEGLMVAMKFKAMFERAKGMIEWAWDIILTLVPFGISAAAQSIDSFIIKDTLASQPSEIQLLVTWGVPAIPAVVIGLILVRGFIESAPTGMFKNVGVSTNAPANAGRSKLRLPGWLNFGKKAAAAPGKLGDHINPTKPPKQ